MTYHTYSQWHCLYSYIYNSSTMQVSNSCPPKQDMWTIHMRAKDTFIGKHTTNTQKYMRKWRTIHIHSDTSKLVINSIISARYVRIIYCHSALITCAWIIQFYVIDGEWKVVIKLISWWPRWGCWCDNGQTTIHPPNTVVLPQFSRLYTAINGGWQPCLKDVGWRNRQIWLRASCRRR